MHLDTVKINFSHWRKSRKGREPIPDQLWKQVYQLGSQYPISQICRTLRISNTQYKANIHKQEDTPQFVEVKNHEVLPETPNKFQFTLTSGEKTLTMDITDAQIPIVFSALQGIL